MPQAIVDPQELRRFAQSLRRFNDDLQGQVTVIQGQLGHLGQTWRDREHDKFVEEFDQTMAAIRHFLEVSTDHIPFLMRKADKIDEYLQQR